MTKRLVDIDDDLLEEVRSLIGAATMKEAVNGALQHVVDFDLRLRHVRRLLTMDGLDLADDQIMRDYDRIAEATGQATEWVVPRGSI